MHQRLESDVRVRIEMVDRLGRNNAIYIVDSLPGALNDIPNGLVGVVGCQIDAHTGKILSISNKREPAYRTVSGSFLALKEGQKFYASPMLVEQQFSKLSDTAAQVIDETIANCNKYWRSL